MTTKQNLAMSSAATTDDVMNLLVLGLAGERSAYRNPALWSGREGAALFTAAQALLPLYRDGLLADDLLARMGRSMARPSSLSA